MAIRVGTVKKTGSGEAGRAGTSSAWAHAAKDTLNRLSNRIRPQEILFFLSQVSLMLETGAPLTKALSALKGQSKNPALTKVIASLHRDVEQGRQLSDAMRAHPSAFDEVFVSMVRAGEHGGFLKQIIDRLVEMMEKRQAFVAQVRATLTYPVVLCVVAVLVIVFILVGVLPRFTSFFLGKEHLLPLTTRALMTASGLLKSYGWAFALAAAGGGIGVWLFAKSVWGRMVFDRATITLPVLARLFNKIYVCQMLRILGHLLESKVPLLEALEMSRRAVRNQYYRAFLDEIVESVEQGGTFARPFSRNPFIMDSVKTMVETGEESGNLSRVMLRLAEFYEAEVEREMKAMAAMIEPVSLVILGGAVALIVSAVVLPMFKLGHAVG
jgi:type II secretory pathway component PulF